MVRLSVSEFARGARRMQELSGTKKARLAIRIRRKDRKIVLRMTDDVNTLTAVVTKQSEFPTFERVLNEYIGGCILDDTPAPAAPASSAAEVKEVATHANKGGHHSKGGAAGNSKPSGKKGKKK